VLPLNRYDLFCYENRWWSARIENNHEASYGQELKHIRESSDLIQRLSAIMPAKGDRPEVLSGHTAKTIHSALAGCKDKISSFYENILTKIYEFFACRPLC
jgi:hypothetical protein